MKTIKKKHPASIWDDRNYVTIYECARQGMSKGEIAKMLGTTRVTIQKWMSKNQAVMDAFVRGRKNPEPIFAKGKKTPHKGVSFREFVYDRLPDPLKILWKELELAEDAPNGIQKAEALLEKAGKNARMHIFLYALCQHNFNPSRACKAVNIPFKTYQIWCSHNSDFAKLVEELHFHKKQYFADALVERVREGDVNATIFANKTLNKDMGFGDSVDININGHIQHSHIHMDELDLTLGERRHLLAKVVDAEDFKKVEAQQKHLNSNVVLEEAK